VGVTVFQFTTVKGAFSIFIPCPTPVHDINLSTVCDFTKSYTIYEFARKWSNEWNSKGVNG